MPEPPENPDLSTLSLTERTLRRDASGQIRAIGVDLAVDDVGESGFELEIYPEDHLNDLISDALEKDINAPYLGSVRYQRAVEAIVRRGQALAQLLSRNERKIENAGALNIIGGTALFDQMWEALLVGPDAVPFAIEKPVIRVVPGATPYAARHSAEGLRVKVINARLDWSTDISPRQVTRPLSDLQDDWESFGMGVVTPAYPNEVEASIVPVSGHDNPQEGAAVLHIDAHGVLLSYEQLIHRYGALRAPFVAQSWGVEIAPYPGLKSFILINGVTPAGELTELPVSGEELAELCRQAGTPLVVLNACQAASEAAEGGIAADLVKAGVPDVIAFRHAVTPGSAIVFVTAFYTALVRGASPAEACCFARRELYRRGVTAVTGGDFPFPDWISLVHYSARPVAQASMSDALADIQLLYSLPELPVSLEWAQVKLQDLLFKVRLSQNAPAEANLPTPQPIILFGPVGAGAETLFMETARWLAKTDLQVSGAALFDVGAGLTTALELYFSHVDPNWSDKQIVDQILRRWGPDHAFGFFNLDLALDEGVMTELEFRRIMHIADRLARSAEVCLIHSSRNLFHRPFAQNLTLDALIFDCWPIPTRDVEDWLLLDNRVHEDPKDRIVTTLLAWVSGGHVDIAGIVRAASLPEQREMLLDYFTLGIDLLNPPHELWILQQQVRARWAVARREGDIDRLLPLVAGIASGIFTDELGHVGQPLGGQRYRRIPRLTVDEILPLQATLHKHGLLSEYKGKVPWGWPFPEGPGYAVLRLNPLLRPLARIGLDAKLIDELDRWAVAYATDKIHYFSNEWLEPERRRRTEIYLDHAWPLFAVAIWIARRDRHQARKLLEAIERAWIIGWWPRDLDLTALFDNATPDDHREEKSEFDRLWQRAVSLQRRGEREEARNLLFLAIESVGGETAGYPYYAAHYRLGTISLDMGDLDQAAEHLKIAADGVTHDFVAPGTHAHIIYEQGVLARARGRDERATERFQASIAMAQELGLHNLRCLNFQELTDMELRHVSAVPLDDRVRAALGHRIAQAEIYLDTARKAARAVGKPTPEEGTLLLLEARVLAARSEFTKARNKACDAVEAYRRWNDCRATVAANFLDILDAVL